MVAVSPRSCVTRPINRMVRDVNVSRYWEVIRGVDMVGSAILVCEGERNWELGVGGED